MAGPLPLLASLALLFILPGCLQTAVVPDEGGDDATPSEGRSAPHSLAEESLAAFDLGDGTCAKKGTLVQVDRQIPQTEASRHTFELTPGCAILLDGRFTAMVGSVKFSILHGDEVLYETDGGVRGPLLIGSPTFNEILSPVPAGSYTLLVTPSQAVSYRLTLEADDAAAHGNQR